MKEAPFLQRTATTILIGIEELNVFTFNLLTRAIHPIVALGLMYWVATNLAGLSVNIFPWWGLVWAIIQAVAITTHLVTLPPRAIEQAQAKEWASFTLTAVTLALLAISSIPLVGPFTLPAFLRTLALVGILFTEPVAQEPRILTVIVPDRIETGIQVIRNEPYNQD